MLPSSVLKSIKNGIMATIEDCVPRIRVFGKESETPIR